MSRVLILCPVYDSLSHNILEGGRQLTVSQHSAFDMGHQILDPFPFYRQSGYFNQAWVQAALGVPLNFTDISYIGEDVYQNIGDALRVDISNLNYILQRGYKVAMVHGDRDYRCNCKSSSICTLTVFLHEYQGLAEKLPAWLQIGRTPQNSRKVDTTLSAPMLLYTGGYVRQTGNFSFSRVFQAGHAGKFRR